MEDNNQCLPRNMAKDVTIQEGEENCHVIRLSNRNLEKSNFPISETEADKPSSSTVTPELGGVTVSSHSTSRKRKQNTTDAKSTGETIEMKSPEKPTLNSPQTRKKSRAMEREYLAPRTRSARIANIQQAESPVVKKSNSKISSKSLLKSPSTSSPRRNIKFTSLFPIESLKIIRILNAMNQQSVSTEEFTNEELALLCSISNEQHVQEGSPWGLSSVVTSIMYNLIVESHGTLMAKSLGQIQKQMMEFCKSSEKLQGQVTSYLEALQVKEEIRTEELVLNEETLAGTLISILHSFPSTLLNGKLIEGRQHFLALWIFLSSICTDIRNIHESKLNKIWETHSKKSSTNGEMSSVVGQDRGIGVSMDSLIKDEPPNTSYEGILMQINGKEHPIGINSTAVGMANSAHPVSTGYGSHAVEPRRPAACPRCKRGKVKCDGRRETCEKRIRSVSHGNDFSNSHNSAVKKQDSSSASQLPTEKPTGTRKSSAVSQQSTIRQNAPKSTSGRCDNCKRRKIRCDGSRIGCTRRYSPPRLYAPKEYEGVKQDSGKTTRCQPCKLAHSKCDGKRSRCLKNPLAAAAPSIDNASYLSMSPTYFQDSLPPYLCEDVCASCRFMGIKCDGKSSSCTKFIQNENEIAALGSDGTDPVYIIV